MTLDETIKHEEELAELNEDQARVYKEQGDTMGYCSYEYCAKEHRQLAEWLRELKGLMNDEEKIKEIKRLIKDYDINNIIKKFKLLSFDEEFEKRSVSEIKDLLWELVCVLDYINDALEEREGNADELN